MTSNRSLLHWIFSLDTENNKQHLPITDDSHYKLADGFICAKVLNQISPKHFTDKWLDGIKAVPPNGSWRLRFSNLKRIFQKISDYANDVLSDQFRPVYPNVEVIAQNFDPEQISKLVQLVLCCAVNCERKNDYINKILTLPEQIQRDIKEAIQELLLEDTQDIGTSKDHISQQSDLINATEQANTSDVLLDTSNTTPLMHRLSLNRTNRRDSTKSSNNESKRNASYLDASHNLSSTSKQEQRTVLTMNEDNIQAVYDLEIKLKQSQLEKDQLQAENDKLMLDFKTINSSPRKLSRASQGALELNFTEDRFSHPRTNENDEDAVKLVAQVEKLQKEVLRMKADLAISDAEKEESKLKTSLLQRDLIEMQTKNQELKHKAEQAKRLQDELDEFRHMSERVTDSETKVEFLHHKIEELRKENKLLEDKNITNFEKILSLEDKNKKLEIAISQIDRYKRQLQEIQSKLIIETHRADKLEVEMVNLNDNHQAVKAENEKLSNIVKDLKRNNKSNSDMKMMFKSDDVVNKFNGDKYDCNSIVDLKARLTQLEIENKFLQSKTANDEKGLKVLMDGLLEESALRCNALESENRKVKKQLMIMEAKYRDQTASTPSSNNQQLDRESSCENNISLANRIEDLQRKLFQREQELMDSEIKNKRNIQKAKEMLKRLETNPTVGERPSYSSSTSSFNSNSIDEFGLLRQQIKEYERQLIDKEREFSQYRKLKELHERLMVSAFYNLTTPRQFKSASQRTNDCQNNSEISLNSSKSNNH